MGRAAVARGLVPRNDRPGGGQAPALQLRGRAPAAYHLDSGGRVDLQLNGRVALITGAGGGIGRETAVLLAREGAKVAAADVRLEAAQDTAQAVRSAGSA